MILLISLSLSHSPSLYLSLALSFSLYLSPLVNWWLVEWLVYTPQSDSSQTFFLFLANTETHFSLSFSHSPMVNLLELVAFNLPTEWIDIFSLSLSPHTFSLFVTGVMRFDIYELSWFRHFFSLSLSLFITSYIIKKNNCFFKLHLLDLLTYYTQ